jgi:hypothetical protein
MNRRKWLVAALLAVPAAVGGGLAYANTTKAKAAYNCPVTGEELPCEKCCPLNGEKSQPAAAEAMAEEPKPAASDAGYTCPITGEKLGCPNCCPLKKAKK